MMSRIGIKGFTLIEIMVTVSILSLGIVALYPSFFMSADAAGYAADQLLVQRWAEKKIWEEEDSFHRLLRVESPRENGTFQDGMRLFAWEKTMNSIDTDLAVLTLTVSWKTSAGKRNLTFGTYLNP
jgi:prepilin-type N-terminal cleavage/methylation domain-containing protein